MTDDVVLLHQKLEDFKQTHRTEMKAMSERIDQLNGHILTHYGDEEGVREEVERLMRLVDGDEDLGVIGLRSSLRDIQGSLNELLEERKQVIYQLKGMKLAAGVAGGAGVVNLVALFQALIGS